jgi:hypothetical protein
MAKSKLQRGFYPISITDVKRYIRNCEEWGYGNKDTCKYVAESVIEKLSIEHEELPIKDTLYQELVSIAHDLNGGGKLKKLEISLVD